MTPEQFWQLHDEYLATSFWHARRDAVLARDRHTCQAALAGCRGEASQAHHLTYAHWRNEPLYDLIAVCRWCHERITGMDRMTRALAPDGRLSLAERMETYGRAGPRERLESMPQLSGADLVAQESKRAVTADGL